MVSITVPLEEEFKKRLAAFPWVNWSEAGREEVLKKDIFNRYLKSMEITDEDWEFCEKMDWHPVDELPMKKEHAKELKEALKNIPSGKGFKSAEEFFRSLE